MMSGQTLELLIFAGIAFFVISKLISVLGKTSNDDPSKRSFFGENLGANLKDVTSTDPGNNAILKPKFLQSKKLDLKGLVLPENKADIENGLKELLEKMPRFNVANFLKGAAMAFEMIIQAAKEQDAEKLEELVDKRYLGKFKERAENYQNFVNEPANDSALISEIYTFGNNIFIKVVFSSKTLKEEWTFSRSAISSDSTWYLNNAEPVGS